MNILILGNDSDVHAAHLHQALTQAGIQTYYWDSQQFPTQMQLSWFPRQATGSLTLPGATLRVEEIHSVFWRSFTGANVLPLMTVEQTRIAQLDAESLLRSFLQIETIRWINSWRAYQFHKEKPRQLTVAHQLGLTIPATLVSNDASEIQGFVSQYPKVIFKPVYGGAHTQTIAPEQLEPTRLQQVLTLSPATFQEYIPGTNIRSYVIGEEVFSAEIRSSALDFREDPKATLIPITLPPDVHQQCLAIARALFLEWTAIDWRQDPEGRYFFLEANPSPMFIHFEQVTGFSITAKLMDLLIG
jgi:glutathione synthase/RimK-type ligase-like ATP-grasp enzyme